MAPPARKCLSFLTFGATSRNCKERRRRCLTRPSHDQTTWNSTSATRSATPPQKEGTCLTLETTTISPATQGTRPTISRTTGKVPRSASKTSARMKSSLASWRSSMKKNIKESTSRRWQTQSSHVPVKRGEPDLQLSGTNPAILARRTNAHG